MNCSKMDKFISSWNFQFEGHCTDNECVQHRNTVFILLEIGFDLQYPNMGSRDIV